MRIVSLLPAATELVCELGLLEQLVGVSHACDFPCAIADLPRVTTALIPDGAASRSIDELVRARSATRRPLYSLNSALLCALKPDLIVTQSLCDVCAVSDADVVNAVSRLASPSKVLDLEPHGLEGVLQQLPAIAAAAGVLERADAAVARLRKRIEAVERRVDRCRDRPRLVFLEWLDPPFSAGHWTPELVRTAGGIERIGREGERSRSITWEEVAQAEPEVIVIACCGLAIARTMADLPALARSTAFMQLAAVQADQVFVMDGNAYFNRPGPRLVDGLEQLAEILHPELQKSDPPQPAFQRVTHDFLQSIGR
jgi:iron complex transport system substrate-binding protein